MATAYTTIGSKFQPYTLAEMLVPYQTYKQEFDKREELYNTYAENAGLIGSQLDDTLDKDLMDTVYNPYMQELNSAAATLSSKGLSSENRKTLQNLRRRFGSDIAPIKVATEARAEARKNWDKLSSQDKTLMTNANPYYQAVSSYMNGKSPETYYVSGNELYSRGKALAEAFSRTLRDVPEGEALANTLGGQYYRITKQYGPDSKQMQDFMNDVADSIPELRSQIEDILNNTDIGKQGFTQEDRNKAEQYIIEGMKAGLSGNTEVQYLQNRNWDLIQADRRRKPEKVPTVPKLPTFLSSMGHEGNGDEFSDIDKFIQALTLKDGKSLSNPELDALLAKYQKDFDTVSEIQSKYGTYTETSSTPTGSLGTSGMDALSKSIAASTSKSKYFIKNGKKTYLGDLSKEEQAAFTKARSNISSGSDRTRIQEIQNKLDSLAERYSYIPGENIVQSIQLGVALDKAQATKEKSGIIPRVTPTEQHNSIDAILNGVSSSLGSGKSQTKGLIDLETGKFISKSDVDNLIHKNKSTEDRLRIIATDSEPVVIHDKDTGKSYAPYGSILEIDDYRNRYIATNNYLKDYSNSETGISNKNAELSEFGLSMLERTGMMPIQGGVDLGKGYYGYITYTSDGDVVKTIVEEDPMTGYGRWLGTSSLRDEIKGGFSRGSFMKDVASGFLYDIFVTNEN
jgi:hypothetical protein